MKKRVILAGIKAGVLFDMDFDAPTGIRGIRELMGLTRAELAEKVGCSPRSVENWENGHRSPSKPAVMLMKNLLE